MATDTRELADEHDDSDSSKGWYDRSSLKGDFMVMIADQTEEDYSRHRPEDRFCEFTDGIVYLHSHASNMPEPEVDPDDPTKAWYDRSSLNGNYMVMIPGQTVEDYLKRAPENKICEYIDGIVYMPSPASIEHQDDVILLAFLLRGFLARRPVGRLILAPASLKVGAKRFLEPDLFVIPPDQSVDSRSFFVNPPVSLVIEVLSKSTRSHDLNWKTKLYRQVKAGEIWFVDRRNQVLIVHRRAGNRYKVLEIESGVYLSQSVPGFWLDLSWLWATPQPDAIACLQTILAGPPA